jgi:predicted DNA-binding transcriptional regulator AlpA
VDDLGKLLEARLEAIVDRALERRLAQRTERPFLLDRNEIAAVLGVSTDTLDRWRKLGLPEKRLPGGSLRFLRDECEEWVRKTGLG